MIEKMNEKGRWTVLIAFEGAIWAMLSYGVTEEKLIEIVREEYTEFDCDRRKNDNKSKS